MGKQIREFSEYKGVWLFALFDLPVDTPEGRRHYSQFRKVLLKQGFTMLQYSVYARYFRSEESCEPFRKRIRQSLPPEGQVRLLVVTDKQFGKMESFIGKKRQEIEEPPPQLMLF